VDRQIRQKQTAVYSKWKRSNSKAMDANHQESKKTNYLALGLCLGLCFGTAFGMIMGAALDNMALMSIGIGSGLSIGLGIGAALDARSKEGSP
jgi:F0F1-type ATP synthase assembly protein I